MTFMSEYEIDMALEHYGFDDERPNLRRAARTMYKLKDWANENSDGWAYWPQANHAGVKLMSLIDDADKTYLNGLLVLDASNAQLANALGRLKAFLTRNGVDHAEVIV